MFLEIFGQIVSILFLAGSLIMSIVMFGSLKFLAGFKNAKETDATIVGFELDYEDEYEGPQDVSPIVSFHNKFSNRNVKMKLRDYLSYDHVENGNMREGDSIKIQYTRNKARSYDERFVNSLKTRYNTTMYSAIICSSFVVGLVGIILI